MDDKRDDVSALLNDSGEHIKERAIAKAEAVVNGLNNIVLNIAVTGESGAGKSSFVNAIRGLKRGDKGYAPTGAAKTTMEVKMYPHPLMPNVRIWDLPGIRSQSFKANTYMKDVNFENYDFFIIVSAFRFKENDIALAKEIKKNKKNFYFVRSQIDLDLRNEVENGEGKEKETLCRIRKDCLNNLSELGLPPIFLITSKDLCRFDFHSLVETLERDLPDHKKNALLLSLPVYSMQSLEKKYNTLKKATWALAVVSGGIAAAPVPGLSLAFNAAMVASFLTKCYFSFGLDDKALSRLSERVDKPILEEVKKLNLEQAISRSMLTAKMVAKLGAAGVADALFSLVPIAGNLAAAGVSFVATRSVLQEGLNELYRVGKKVIEMAELQ